MNGLLVFWFLQAMIFGGFCAWLAKQKNRDPVGWFLLGALFSLIALIAIAASRSHQDRTNFLKEDQKKLGGGW